MAPSQEAEGKKDDRRTKWVNGLTLIATMLVIAAAVLTALSIGLSKFVDLAASLVVTGLSFMLLASLLCVVIAVLLVKHDPRLHMRQILYQSAGFLILALSLRAFAIHDVPPGESIVGHIADTFYTSRTIAELCSVMILFVLIEIASFVARDVEEAKLAFEAAVKQSQETVATSITGSAKVVQQVHDVVQQITKAVADIRQLRFVTQIAALDQEVMEEAIPLIGEWAKRAPAIGTAEDKDRELSSHCWRVLLREYMKEEKGDFRPEAVDAVGVPASVQPLGKLETHYFKEDVSYIATNVGFYAKYVSELVADLSLGLKPGEKVCIAVVTNVLPGHWWNWTFSVDEWRAYPAISEFRQTMNTIASQGKARVDRVIAVWADEGAVITDDPDENPQPKKTLWPESLLCNMLENWQLILNAKDQEKPLDCSKQFEKTQGDVGKVGFPLFNAAIRKGAQSELYGAKIYPMIRRSIRQENYELANDIWVEHSLRDAYEKQHAAGDGAKGKYWALRVDGDNFESFDGHFDAMFIGVGKPAGTDEKEGLFGTQSDINWGVCLMNSADAAVETMFLTVISGRSVRRQFDHWREEKLKNLLWSKWELPGYATTYVRERGKKLDTGETSTTAPSDPNEPGGPAPQPGAPPV